MHGLMNVKVLCVCYCGQGAGTPQGWGISSVERVSLTKLIIGTEKLYDMISNIFQINFKSQEFYTLLHCSVVGINSHPYLNDFRLLPQCR
jgi:hypothetical protein